MDDQQNVSFRLDTISGQLVIVTRMLENLTRPRGKSAVDEVVPRRLRLNKRAPNRCKPEILEKVKIGVGGMDQFKIKDLCELVYGPFFERRDQMQVSAALKALGFERYRSSVIINGSRPEMWRKIAPAVLDRQERRQDERTERSKRPILDYEVRPEWKERAEAAVRRAGVEPIIVDEFCKAVSGKIDAAERVKVCKLFYQMGMYDTDDGNQKVWKMPPGLVAKPVVPMLTSPPDGTTAPPNIVVPTEVKATVERVLDGGTVTRFDITELGNSVFIGRLPSSEEFSWLRAALAEMRYEERTVYERDSARRLWCRHGDDGSGKIEE